MRGLSKVAGFTVLLGSSLLSVPADACGGLFCSSSNPVNQAAERIIFAQGAGDTVDAIIEIQYEGPSENFAWVLPVPAGPVTVGVSSKQLLDALQQQSNPVYNLNTTFENCGVDGNGVSQPGSTSGPAGGNPSSPEGVQVVGSGTVGPYDWVQLSVEDAADPADVAVKWLGENGFDVSNVGADLLASYLEGGMDLIAFRLTKGSNTGSIRPITLRYEADNPVIPLRPTAVAANEDMGVMVWVLGDARAVPTNFLDLELNEAKINWFNAASNYNDVVIAAADEAGGQGFVTEQSGPSSTFRDALYPSWKSDSFNRLRTGRYDSLQTFFYDAVSFAQSFDPFTGSVEFYDGFIDVMSDPEVLPLREGATGAQFVGCVDCYFQVSVPVRNDAYPPTPYDAATDPIHSMNVEAFLDALEEAVVKPLTDGQALFDEHSTITRFYTTLSPDEMTADPVFDFNDDLPPVSNVHTADRVIRCDGTQRITLAQGVALDTDGFTWPVPLDGDIPMNLRVLQLSTKGSGDVAMDNRERIVTQLEELGVGTEAEVASPSAGDEGPNGQPTADESTYAGCSVGGTERVSKAWVWVLLGLPLLMRRRAPLRAYPSLLSRKR